MKPRPGRVEAAVFALALAAALLPALAIAWSGTGTYAAIARDAGFEEGTFRVPADAATAEERPHGLEQRLALHRATLAYVMGSSAELPSASPGGAFYSDAEAHHLADVQGVFALSRASIALGAIALALLGVRAARGGAALRLARGGGLAAAVGVIVLAVLAAVAFWPFFLAFHYVFFPQGNFLFDPATSNLVRLYPLEYWQGVTLRLFGSFVAISGLLAMTAHLLLRWRRARDGGAASKLAGR